jgi:negative regulator of replication initiation
MKQIEIDLDVSREIEVARLSFSETENDILRRLLRIGWSEGSSVSRPEEQIGQRSTGTFSFTYKRERFREASLKTAYKRLLLLIHADNSDFLSELAEQPVRRGRIVSKDKQALYQTSPHLAEQYAEKLTDDYWYDTNLSTDQTKSRIRLACGVAGLDYGDDVRLDF